MEGLREQVVSKVAELDASMHHDIFNFIRNFEVDFTQNNNGMFMDLNSMSQENLVELLEKIDQLMMDAAENCFVFENENEDAFTDIDSSEAPPTCEELVKYDTEKSPLLNKTAESNAIKHFESLSYKLNKKNAQNKFSVIKKKYNKQLVVDHLHKKLDDTHLSELRAEEYIIPSKHTDEHAC